MNKTRCSGFLSTTWDRLSCKESSRTSRNLKENQRLKTNSFKNGLKLEAMKMKGMRVVEISSVLAISQTHNVLSFCLSLPKNASLFLKNEISSTEKDSISWSCTEWPRITYGFCRASGFWRLHVPLFVETDHLLSTSSANAGLSYILLTTPNYLPESSKWS